MTDAAGKLTGSDHMAIARVIADLNAELATCRDLFKAAKITVEQRDDQIECMHKNMLAMEAKSQRLGKSLQRILDYTEDLEDDTFDSADVIDTIRNDAQQAL